MDQSAAGDGADGGDAAEPSAETGPAEAGAPDSAGWPGIRCVGQYCSGPDVCCYSNVYDPVDGGTCRASTQCFAPSRELDCATTADCAAKGHPSYECCGSLSYITLDAGVNDYILSSAQCVPSCTRALLTVVLCDPNDEPSIAQCSAIDAGCKSYMRHPAGYFTCQ